jgi:hypothetical protein
VAILRRLYHAWLFKYHSAMARLSQNDAAWHIQAAKVHDAALLALQA